MPREAAEVAEQNGDVRLARSERFVRTYGSAVGPSLIVGLSGTTIALVWFLLAPKQGAERRDPPSGRAPSTPRAPLTPWLGASGAGVTLDGRF